MLLNIVGIERFILLLITCLLLFNPVIGQPDSGVWRDAHLLDQQGKWDEAINLISSDLEKETTSLSQQLYYAQLLTRAGEKKKATEVIEKVKTQFSSAKGDITEEELLKIVDELNNDDSIRWRAAPHIPALKAASQTLPPTKHSLELANIESG